MNMYNSILIQLRHSLALTHMMIQSHFCSFHTHIFSTNFRNTFSKHPWESTSSILNLSLDGNSESILEGALISSCNGSASGDLNLRSNFLDETSRDNSVRSALSLKVSERSLVNTAYSNNINLLGAGVGGTTGKRNIGLYLVQHGKVDGWQLVRSGNCCKKISLAVWSSYIERSEGLSLDAVSSISSNDNSSLQSQTSRGRNLRQVLNIKLGGSAEISLFVVSSKISSLASLEGEFESWCGGEGGLEGLSSIGFELSLVEGKSSVGELGSDLWGKGSSGCTGCVDGDCYRSSRLLTFETNFGAVVVVDKVY
jgi:hypothetical protein